MFKSGLHKQDRGFSFKPRILRRLNADNSGATALEFAIVATPFFALMLAIMQVSLVYIGNLVLENAVEQAGRMIRTGQVQQQGFSEEQFKQEVCDGVTGIFDCMNGLKLDVQRFENFTGVDDGNFNPPLDEGGGLDDSGFGFDPGNGGDVVLVRAYYVWDLISIFPESMGDIELGLSNMPGGRLLMATAAFRNEPFDG